MDKFNLLVYSAIVFSWGGDILLLIQDLFIYGLMSFLVCHLLYITIYISEANKPNLREPISAMKKVLITLPYLAFLAIALFFLYPHLGDLTVPVCIYAVTIILMARLTWLRYARTTLKSF